ncbi:hypothetical protein Rsub_01755 [Raphidocelis subcapitata]|uniref:Uncharacterized protein n=1 Tax=Raphidocelis subcapitata TaxID=307507 RepID=A0A2V0NNA1_9CHLO|nr:hypothetical protein Rsub_01755 [Raphidocelis subcapitata]|eukprot:GBF89038.1 hypothetical protein Rsub_01755 [Raphidocelis subcapitata]
MDAAAYQRSSSLARKFVSDFPDVAHVPLQLPAEQLAAFQATVKPLLDLAESGSPHVAPAALLAAMRRLVAVLEADPARYGLLRGVADYVQCTFAQCVVDAAAAWALNQDRRAYRAALGPAAADDAMLCELRCRLVAAGVDDLTQPLACKLRLASAPAGGQPEGAAFPLFPTAVERAVGDGAPVLGPDGVVAWPVLRRALAAAGGHYLEAVLGGEGRGEPAGAIVLTGSGLIAAVRGARPHPAVAPGPAYDAGLPDSAAAARWFDLAIVGAEGGPGAAGRAVEGFVREVLTRHKMRHAATPVLGTDGRPLRPLLLLTHHSLYVLLPEHVHAADGAPRPRDVGIRLRLGLVRSIEALLLPTPVPPPVEDGVGRAAADGAAVLAAPPAALGSSWYESVAYDGDTLWALPAGLRALASGRHPIDPLRLRTAAEALVQIADSGQPAGSSVPRASADLVRALALCAWQPEALLPPGRGAEAAYRSSGVLGTLVAASEADGDGGGIARLPDSLSAEAGAALLDASLEALAAGPAALRAALALGGQAQGGVASAAAGAAAGARELQRALTQRHGWLWAEVTPDAEGELPAQLALALGWRLQPPPHPLPAEPLAAEDATWFY